MVQYAGQRSFPKDYLLPNDGVKPTAAQVNVGLEALGDRTRWLYESAALGVLETRAALTEPAKAAGMQSGRPAYNLRRREWFAGFSDAVYATRMRGGSWRGHWANNLRGIHLAFVNDGANPRYGNGIGVEVSGTTGRFVFVYTPESGGISGAMPAVITKWNGVLHEPVSDKWLAWGQNGGAGYVANAPTSTNTFTARTLPASSTVTTGCATDGIGNVLLVNKTNAIAISTNGGDTWTQLGTLPFGGTQVTGIGYDADRARFVALSNVPSPLATEVWTTDDLGASWTLQGTVSGVIAVEPTAIGPLLVAAWIGATGDGGLIGSVDGGATWSFVGDVAFPSTSNVVIASSGADALVLNLGASADKYAFTGQLTQIII